jgi:ureidoglycolate dehydrogenase (NAD+)
MNISLRQIKELLITAAKKYVSESEAEYFATLWLESHFKKAPRMNPLEEAVFDLKVWRDHADHQIKTVVEKPGACVIDFNQLAPSLRIKHVHDDLEKRAKLNGLAATGFYNSTGITTLGMWSDGLAKRDLIGISMFNGGTNCCVPFGGKRGIMGTNPMAYAIPTNTHPMGLDMATTEIPFFEIKQAKEKNKPLRPNAAVNQKGIPTTDASAALNDDGVANLLPIGGGFKGYGIMLLIEILTGSLIRSLLSTEQTSGWNPPEYGCLILAIDIGSFTDLSTFKTKVSEMCEVIRQESPAEGFDSVSIPGDRGNANLKQIEAKGEIELKDELYDELMSLTK